jgi:UPF0755 protein
VSNNQGRLPEKEARRSRGSAVGRVIGWLIGWGIIAGALGGALATYGWLNFNASGPLVESKVLIIEKGLGRPEIASQLQAQGVIADSRIFSLAAAVNALRGRYIKPGEYQLTAGASMRDVLAEMLAGRVITYKLTIPEGWTTEMAVARLTSNDVLQGDVTKAPAEGFVLANTFNFPRGTSRQKMIDDMAAAQTKLLEELWSQRDPATPLKSKEELLTLASIVEKETGVAAERARIAAVFLNRLKKGMRLQSDPTIIYGLVGGQGKLDRQLTRADIDKPTPYNTYTIDGLPPGPIAIPGRAALEAVIKPAQTEELYFVADGSGGHAFAKSLDEHNANVAKWRKIENAPAIQNPEEPAQSNLAATEALAKVPLDQAQEQAAAEEPAQLKVEPELQKPPEPAPDQPPVVADTPADTGVILDLKPGSTLLVANKRIPIPAPRNLKR